MMKKIFYAVVFLLGMSAMLSCEKFDDTDIWKEISTLQSRVAKLEDLCKVMNTNISSLQTIVNALQNNDYISNVAPVVKDGETIGYTITFAKDGPITILNGENGKDGVNGQDGQNGKDGKDGATPVISVVLGEDGLYYWTVNGEYLLDANGNKIAASGKDGVDGKDGEDGQDGKDGEDGQDGQDGKDGEDGITPQLKIENGGWYVSVDNGATWKYLGSATATSSSPIVSVDDTNDNYVIFTLTNGTSIKVPKTPSDDYVEFEDLAFKYYCLAYFDTDKDGRISKEEAAAVTEMSNLSAVSLKGIEYFINLQRLDCPPEFYLLDISKNTALTYLNCSDSRLTSLDVSNNTALTQLICSYCHNLTSLDVSNNPALTELNCDGCDNLTSLDVSNNPALTELHCDNTNLTSLDVSNCPALTYLVCGSPNLTSLDLSNNPALTYLACGGLITSLDLSNCPALTYLACGGPITSLDLSNNPALTELDCGYTNLTSLDLSNNPALTHLNCYGCDNLTEIWLKSGQKIDYLYYDERIVTIKYR